MSHFPTAPDAATHFGDVNSNIHSKHYEALERMRMAAEGLLDVVTEARLLRFPMRAELGYSDGPELTLART